MNDRDRIRDYFETASWRPSAGRTFLVRERTRLIHAQVSSLGVSLEQIRICDVGCGAGSDLVAWREAGVAENRIAGTELVPAYADAARQALPGADIRIVDGFDLPFDTASFDVCTASLVLSTIHSQGARRRLVLEMARVTRPGGLVMVYDFAIRKPWNRNVGAVTTRQVSALLRPPDELVPAAPFLPFLDLVLGMPERVQAVFVDRLPKTHRLWIWRQGSDGADR